MFRVIPLGLAKVPGSGFLGFVASGLSNLQRGGGGGGGGGVFLLSFEGFKLIHFFFMFVCL